MLTNSGSMEIVIGDNVVTKIERYYHKKKRNVLETEWAILKDLESKGSMVSPKPIEYGTLPSGNNYLMMEKVANIGCVKNKYDILFSVLALKGMGYIHGDYKDDNMSLESGRCVFIDFDQSLKDGLYITMSMDDFIHKLVETNKNKLKPFYYESVRQMLTNDRLDLSKTTLFQTGVSTKTKTGVYHPISTNNLFIDGERGLDGRIGVLSNIPFESNERILDIGCNTGLIVRYLVHRRCKEVDGYEYSKEHAIAGQMINNTCSIFNSKIYHKDLTKDHIEKSYDTIMLFSVLHHFDMYEHPVNEILNCGAKRILIESRLIENGMVYDSNHWRKASHEKWNFRDMKEMVGYIEKMFVGFKFKQDYGPVDRNRHILEFTRL